MNLASPRETGLLLMRVGDPATKLFCGMRVRTNGRVPPRSSKAGRHRRPGRCARQLHTEHRPFRRSVERGGDLPVDVATTPRGGANQDEGHSRLAEVPPGDSIEQSGRIAHRKRPVGVADPE